MWVILIFRMESDRPIESTFLKTCVADWNDMTKSCNITEHIQFCRQGTTRTNCPAVNSSVVHPTKVRLRRRFIRWEAVIVLLLLPHDFALSKLLLGCLHGNDAMVHTATSQSHSFLQGQVSTSTSVFLPDWNSRKITTCHPKKLRNLKMDFSLQKVFASFFWQVPAVFFFFFREWFLFASPSWKSSNLQAPKFLSPPSTLQSRWWDVFFSQS